MARPLSDGRYKCFTCKGLFDQSQMSHSGKGGYTYCKCCATAKHAAWCKANPEKARAIQYRSDNKKNYTMTCSYCGKAFTKTATSKSQYYNYLRGRKVYCDRACAGQANRNIVKYMEARNNGESQ